MADEVTIRALALDGTWETIGVDRARGIHPTGVGLQADVWGPTKASFDLRRDPGIVWPDLRAYTPIEVECDGLKCWSGRIAETPARPLGERVINVQCDGWQYHLDDNTYEQIYVHTRLAAWRDMRSFLSAELGSLRATAQGQVSNDGAIQLAFTKDDDVSAGAYVGVVLDLGESLASRISVDYETSDNSAGFGLYVRAVTAPDSSAWTVNDTISGVTLDTLGASGSDTGSFTTPCRYVHVFLHCAVAASPPAADVWVKLTGLRVYTDDAYESAGVSVLKASTVFRDALAQGTQLLSSDLSLIDDTLFDIEDFAPDGDHSPRENINAVNALHDWLTQIDVDRRPVFRAKPSTPVFEIGAWPGSTWEDASQNSGDEIYDRVPVTGQNAAGDPIRVVRSQTGTLVDRRGGHRSKQLPVRSMLSTAIANQVGDVWLTGHRSTPMRGTAQVTKGGARDVISGADVPPALLLMRIGEMLRLAHLIDPDTGDHGRDVRIAGVTYKPADSTAEVTLDNSRASVEAMLERLAVVQGAA